MAFHKLADEIKENALVCDSLIRKINRKQTGDEPMTPASTLDRLTKEIAALKPLIEDILQKQEEQNAHVEQTIRLLNTRLLIDRERVERLRSKIDAYTVVKDTPVEPPPKVIEKPKTPPPAVNETDEETVSTANATTPPPTTPERKPLAEMDISTPKLANFLPLDVMMNCVDNNLQTTRLKSTGKKGTPNISSLSLSSSKAKRGLMLGTPGRMSCLDPSTPVLTVENKPLPMKHTAARRAQLNNPDRIALVDIAEYMGIDSYLRSIISLEMLNSVIDKVELFTRMGDPKEPVSRQKLKELVQTIAGPRSNLLLRVMEKLNRLRAIPGKADLIEVVHGRKINDLLPLHKTGIENVLL